MKSIHIIVHCWSEALNVYSRMLTAQLSSLLQFRPQAQHLVTVCTAPSDEETRAVVNALLDLGVNVEVAFFERPELLRRAIGRNQVAKGSMADIVWFADCDAMFGAGCLDSLAAASFDSLVFPKVVRFHRTHAQGDRDLSAITPGEPNVPNLDDFKAERIKFASGGYLIVPGDVARRGFMDGTKWTRPAPADYGFFCNPREDIIYRKQFTGSSRSIDLPNLYRFRHSKSTCCDKLTVRSVAADATI